MVLDGFGDRLKKLRRRNSISQEQLAKAMCVSRPCIRNWEVGVRMPPLEALIKLALYFHVTTDYLLGMENHRCIQLDFLSDSSFEAVSNMVRVLHDEYDRAMGEKTK